MYLLERAPLDLRDCSRCLGPPLSSLRPVWMAPGTQLDLPGLQEGTSGVVANLCRLLTCSYQAGAPRSCHLAAHNSHKTAKKLQDHFSCQSEKENSELQTFRGATTLVAAAPCCPKEALNFMIYTSK